MSQKSDPAVLVTGATGFIGRHVVTRILVAGRRVVIVARRRAGLTGEQRLGEIFGETSRQSLEVAEADLANPAVLRRQITRLNQQCQRIIEHEDCRECFSLRGYVKERSSYKEADMPFAQAGDVKLHYETFGQGVPFLFVSGTGWPGEPWKLCQAPAFADRYQVIVYDHRGVGKSDAPGGYYSTRMFAQDAANLLDAIGVTEPVHTIGHSMGGRVCQWLAIDHPRKVRSMIQAASGSGSMDKPDYPRWLTLDSLESMIEKGYKEYMWGHFQSRFFFPPDYVKARPDVLETLFKTFWDHRPQLDPYLRHVIARNQHETGDSLHKITTPTLVLVGSEDKAASDTGNHYASSEHLRDNIAGAEFAVVPGCGHGFFWQKPEEVNKIIRDWLDRH